ncbi:MAG: hypothetical protein M3Z37_11485, partial [Candidatus Eremiobacteraeota bacterium]|nr:hypothetical protein [Candidatus Eremiobacteraeota bacterium]
MHKLRAGLLALVCVGIVTGCTTNTSPGTIITGKAVLELAVGTLNDPTGNLNPAGVYLNAVTSFRNSFGASAFVNPGSAVLTGPAGISVTLGGLFSYGQFPGTNFVVGAPPAYTPASAIGGYSTGFILTGVTPPTGGGYTVTATVPVNGAQQSFSASATLPGTPTVLGVLPTPVYVPAAGTGGGTVTVAPPSGVTETLIVISSGGSVTTTGSAIVATVETTGTTATVPAGTLSAGTAYT